MSLHPSLAKSRHGTPRRLFHWLGEAKGGHVTGWGVAIMHRQIDSM